MRHRFIPGMAENGFVVAPYIGTTDDFVDIAAGVSTTQVKRIRIVVPQSGFWKQNFHVQFSSFPVLSQDVAAAIAQVSSKSAVPPAFRAVSATKAQCYLESLNGMSAASLPAGGPMLSSGISVVGWASPSAAKGILPNETWLMLEAIDGSKNFYKAQIVDRVDVATVFKHPTMVNVGFKAKIREAAVGLKTISVLTVRDGVIQDCGIRQPVIFAP